jgi:hypothetical protein
MVAPSSSALGRVAWAHPVATIVEQFAGEERVRVLTRPGPARRLFREQPLDLVPRLRINDWIVKTIVGLVLVCQPADVDRVR